MTPHIEFKKVWEDNDVYELAMSACDGRSIFCTNLYAGVIELQTISNELRQFSPGIYGGLYDLRIGEFGPEYASGALMVRFAFDQTGSGKIFLTVSVESEWFETPQTKVASNARLYLKSEAILLNQFISEFSQLASGNGKIAQLEGISYPEFS